ncbi:DNA gyrase inhibitor YacG [Asticcacaulis sp. BYS171W]|uniref:DNA gyrase inhibitor YacG n=1 Tax=Asticcacaulis aquaticus TaxID=2984212 RepID=A0ABT5HV76_9CAUL|nr:DNA gyrase inhibitor YacG [Asticcacaulis aquaticus]MDC7683874.1 DNA gyrase inhibitor YacG [Asticcacaulis aquaticus]
MTEKSCALCHKPYHLPDPLLPNAAKSYAPFCSKRCADIDTLHWLKGDYVIGGEGNLSTEGGDEGEAAQLSSPFDGEDAD